MKTLFLSRFSGKVILVAALSLLLSSCVNPVKLIKQGYTGSESFKSEFPFEMRAGLIIIKVQIGNETYDFILDSGAPNVISKELAQKLKLKTKASVKSSDSQGNRSKLDLSVLAAAKIGDVEFKDCAVAIADVNKTTELSCLKVDGLIGANLMRKAIWQIDFRKGLITICSNAESLTIPPDAKRVSFAPSVTGSPIIEVKYGEASDKRVTVDLGSNGDFSSSMEIGRAVKSAGPQQRSTFGMGSTSIGIFGSGSTDTSLYIVLNNISFGDAVLQKQVASFSKTSAHTIGTKFFRHYTMILNWKSNEMRLIEQGRFDNLNENILPFKPTYRDDKVFVSAIYAFADKQPQNIEVGDQILEINGISFESGAKDRFCEFLLSDKKNEARHYHLRLMRKGTVQECGIQGRPLFSPE